MRELKIGTFYSVKNTHCTGECSCKKDNTKKTSVRKYSLLTFFDAADPELDDAAPGFLGFLAALLAALTALTGAFLRLIFSWLTT